MGHPKHVYIFKKFIHNVEEKGHKVKIVLIPRDITRYLLKKFNLPYEVVGENPPEPYKRFLLFPKWDYNTLKYAIRFKPDIFMGPSGPNLAHVSAILHKPFIVLEDTEVATFLHRFNMPFTDVIITPNCFRKDFGKKHVRFNSYFELAYLHPNYFTPNPSVLNDLGLSKNDKFIILRFSEFRAMHDIGHSDIDIKSKYQIINKLKKYGQIFISSESPLPERLEKMKLKAPPEKMHDILYYATMLFGVTGTMASEAGILGTPSIRCTTHVGPNDCGNFIELEKKYGLIYSFKYPNMALKKAIELLEDDKLKNKWLKKSRKLIEDKIDVTEFMEKFVESYLNSDKKKT